MEESDSRWTGAAIAGEGSDRKWRGDQSLEVAPQLSGFHKNTA